MLADLKRDLFPWRFENVMEAGLKRTPRGDVLVVDNGKAVERIDLSRPPDDSFSVAILRIESGQGEAFDLNELDLQYGIIGDRIDRPRANRAMACCAHNCQRPHRIQPANASKTKLMGVDAISRREIWNAIAQT